MDEICPLQSSKEAVLRTSTLRDGTPSDYILEVLSDKIVNWKRLGRCLGLSDPQLEQINQAHNQLSEKVYHMLKHWKHGKGSSAATYKALCDALSHELVQRQDLAEKFCYINEPFTIPKPAGSVSAERVTGEVSGATASTHDSGDSTGARSTLKRKHLDPDPERENLKDTLKQMRNLVKKLESFLDEDKLQQMKSEIANMSEKLNTVVAQRETDAEDNTRDDFKEMARDIRTISEKLKSQVTSGEEGNSRDNLEQMKTKIADIKETLDTLMNPLPLEEKKQKMEESLKETLEQMGDQLKNVSETLDSLRQASQDEENLKETHKQMRNHEKNISGKLDSLREPSQDEVDERVIWNAAITFEAEHEECVRVLPYFQNGDVEIHLYVYNDRSGIPTELKNAAQAFFGQKRWKLIWADLYNDAFNLLKITSIEYSSGKPKRLEASQVDEIDEIINKHLHVFSKHRNVTAVQPSFKVTNSVQTQEACIVVYVLGKGQIPLGESAIPDTIGSYPVDIVNGFCVRTNDPYLPTEAHEQKEFLRLGASIGVNGKESSGSLGAIVEDVNRGTLYALSCDHVMNNADEKKIIHPGLDVYLNYLRYHLGEYKGWVERTIRPSVELPTFPDHTLEETELQNMFSDLKILKENYIASGIRRVSESRLNQIQLYEDKLEEAFRKRPRVIGKYLAGVRYNVKLETNSGKEHFIDAAISELNEDEVEKVKAEGEVEIIGTNHYPNGECLSATAVVNDLFKSGSATGFTRSNRLADELGNRPTYIRGQGNGRWIDVECINCSKTGPAQSQARDVLSPCEQCKTERWLKRCLCIQQQGAKPFSDIGDSGAVIFEERGNEKLAAPGFAIIFAELPTQYYKFAVALPLEIALEALSKEVSKLRPNSSKPCQLKLASKF